MVADRVPIGGGQVADRWRIGAAARVRAAAARAEAAVATAKAEEVTAKAEW